MTIGNPTQPSQLAGPIVVAGHACLDVIPAFAAAGASIPTPGGLTEVGPAVIATGGAVPNTGLALHKLGARVRLVATVGDDLFGECLRDLLAASGAESRLSVRAGASTSYSVVLAPPGVDRSFLHSPGANHDFTSNDVRDEDLAGAIALHFGYPTAMRAMWQRDGEELQRLLSRGRALGAMTSLDTCSPGTTGDASRVDWRSVLKRVLPATCLFGPNVDELRLLLRRAAPADGLSDVHSLAEELLALGATVVVIKLGEEGLYLRTSNDRAKIAAWKLSDAWVGCELRRPCFLADVASTTGSGDCTIAGLLLAMLCRHEPIDAIKLANAVGAFSVESPDATGGIRPWNEVLDRIERGWARRPPTPQRNGSHSDAVSGAAISSVGSAR